MKNRLARIFDPDDCRTVMLAVDHGYFQGPTTGLERIDITIVPLDSLRRRADDHAGRACAAPFLPEMSKPVVLRSSGGQSILKELSNELIAVDIEDAIRLNASAMAVQVYIGGVHEHRVHRQPGARSSTRAIATAFPPWRSPAWARNWCAMPSTWAWQRASVRKWARIS